MSAEIIPFGGLTLCTCGYGIACVPIFGGIVCNECAESLRAQRQMTACASIMLQDPGEKGSLDEILARLVKS